MHVFIRVCTDRRSDVLKRQFNVVDGQEWQRQKAKQDDLLDLFVRVGISQSHFLHALNNCLRKMEPRHLRTLRCRALSSIRSSHLLVFHQTLHSKLSLCGIDSTSMFYYAKLISEYYYAIFSQCSPQ